MSQLETTSSQAENRPEVADDDQTPQVVRRRQRMVPRPPAEDEGPVVNRSILTDASHSRKPQTRRNRKLVGSLPDWDPLPPGEVRISKPRTAP